MKYVWMLIGLCWSYSAIAGCALDKPEHLQNHQIVDASTASQPVLDDLLAKLMTDGSSPQLQFEIGIAYFNLAGPGLWSYLDRAKEHLEAALAAMPGDPLVMMHLGRAIGARALDTAPATLKRLSWAREGFRIMDKALGMNPTCHELRLMRAESALMAHPILRRAGRLREDAMFVQQFTDTGEYAKLAKTQQARIQLFIGNYFHKRKKDVDRIQQHWRLAIMLADDSTYADEARARLKGAYHSPGYVDEKS